MGRQKDLKSPKLLINREVSWLEFNNRVLQEGLRDDLALAERLKFLSIVSSNLDEYFMIRVAGLMQQRINAPRALDPSGMTAKSQLDLINKRVHKMVAEQTAGIRDVFGKLAQNSFHVLSRADWNDEQAEFLRQHFNNEILPVLTPVAIEGLNPAPVLPGLQLFVAFSISTGRARTKIVAVPVPGLFQRFVNIPTEDDTFVTPVEEVIAANAQTLFGDGRIVSAAYFRITRDADVSIQEDEAADLLSTIARAVRERRRRAAVRLEISASAEPRMKRWLTKFLNLGSQDIYEVDGLLNASGIMQLVDLLPSEEMKSPGWPEQPVRDLNDSDDLWATIQEKDVLLFHPYESFEPVMKFVDEAANDPNVLAIKQTLYRTSGKSPLVQSLASAAESGKEVTVLVELKARFDESRNVNWALELEDAGCHVIYGIARLKTHAKAMLIVRREQGCIRRYAHLSTGNYNDRTAKLYSDIGLMTCNPDITADVAAFFNLLTGQSETVGWKQLTIAPTNLRQKFLDLIDREIQASTPGDRGLIIAKLNALQDPVICQALYRASQAGVRVKLNIRGICVLRPGIKKVSDNIEVRSILDRYLEHSRIYYFRNGGHEEIYLSSADWMRRNLDRRLEILFPVLDGRARARVMDMLKTFFDDNVQSWQLLPDGTYKRVSHHGKKIRAQEKFYQDAVDAASAAYHIKPRFRPLSRPDKQ
ncbi:MAG: polyphosphate kinase 1 [Sedimentisphaerales bacterium]